MYSIPERCTSHKSFSRAPRMKIWWNVEHISQSDHMENPFDGLCIVLEWDFFGGSWWSPRPSISWQKGQVLSISALHSKAPITMNGKTMRGLRLWSHSWKMKVTRKQLSNQQSDSHEGLDIDRAASKVALTVPNICRGKLNSLSCLNLFGQSNLSPW